MNFINNAIDYVDSKREIRVAIASHIDKAKIIVFNSGENIPDDLKDKVWTSFFKADKSRTREYGGTGLVSQSLKQYRMVIKMAMA